MLDVTGCLFLAIAIFECVCFSALRVRRDLKGDRVPSLIGNFGYIVAEFSEILTLL